jgi:hypothetical protein
MIYSVVNYFLHKKNSSVKIIISTILYFVSYYSIFTYLYKYYIKPLYLCIAFVIIDFYFLDSASGKSGTSGKSRKKKKVKFDTSKNKYYTYPPLQSQYLPQQFQQFQQPQQPQQPQQFQQFQQQDNPQNQRRNKSRFNYQDESEETCSSSSESTFESDELEEGLF